MTYLWYLVPFTLFVSAVAWESGIVASAAVLLLASVSLLLGFNPGPWMVANPFLSGLGIVGYFLVGALWSLFKYYLWLKSERDHMLDEMAQWRASQSKNADLSIAAFGRSTYAAKWKPRYNKSRLVFWMTWWVPSVFWTLTHDLFTKAWRVVYDLVVREYERLADRVIRRNLG